MDYADDVLNILRTFAFMAIWNANDPIYLTVMPYERHADYTVIYQINMKNEQYRNLHLQHHEIYFECAKICLR